MKIAKGGWSHILASILIGGGAGYLCRVFGWQPGEYIFYVIGLVLLGFMIYFFRDPERTSPTDANVIVSGADGWVRAIEKVNESKYLKTDTLRISTFLTPFDVHVNRAPIEGKVTALAYTPSKHILTIQQAASEYNEHSTILIEGANLRCLVKQIVGPVVRRVVYWLQEGQPIGKGERIGLMKFGSRLDVYLPAGDVEILVKKGDRVFAGKTVIARRLPRE